MSEKAKYFCEECGSTNIHVLAWIDANTHEFRSGGPGETQDQWCEDCKAHVGFTFKAVKNDHEQEA